MYIFTDRYKSSDVHKCQGLWYWRPVNAIHTGSIHHRPPNKSITGFIANPQTSKPESLFKGITYFVKLDKREWFEEHQPWYRLKSYLQDATGLVIHLAHMENGYFFHIYFFYNISALKLNNTMLCKSFLVPISVLQSLGEHWMLHRG